MESWEIVMTGGGRRGPPLRVLGDGPTGIPVGGSGRVRIAAPMGPYMKKITVELSEPPEGIAIRKVFYDKSSVVVEFSADAGKVKPGLKGNLILNAFTQYTPKGKDGKPRPARRVPIGALPAVPFEIVASSAKP
jgi:hypothetical protein